MIWEMLYPGMTAEHLGLLPGFLRDDDPRPAREQINERYAHGGGWRPMKGHRLGPRNFLTYPGDPPLPPVARARLRNELILFYPSSWVCIVQPDQSYEVCRID